MFKDNNYMPTYSCDMGKEAAIMAVISLVLTIVNIICIFITATAVLKVTINCFLPSSFIMYYERMIMLVLLA